MLLWVFRRTASDSLISELGRASIGHEIMVIKYLNNTALLDKGNMIHKHLHFQTNKLKKYIWIKLFFNPLLFVSCTDTFSKWCKITRGMKRSAQ
jgi:hypothetical protein